MVSVGLLGASVTASAAASGDTEGEHLFKYHGCVNCHGDQGQNPTSKLVPKIGGLEANEIAMRARKILRGEGDSEEAKLMHSAIAYSQSCDAPPTDADLEKIAAWLAQQ